jgi:hypothetical protein
MTMLSAGNSVEQLVILVLLYERQHGCMFSALAVGDMGAGLCNVGGKVFVQLAPDVARQVTAPCNLHWRVFPMCVLQILCQTNM